MTLQDYLKHKRRYEAIVIGVFLVLIGTTNATSEILRDYQEGFEANWLHAFAAEFTAASAVPMLFPLLFPFLNWLNLDFQNMRWRILWHIPGSIIFSLLFVSLFNIIRVFLWSMVGAEYEIGPVTIGLLYEMRKAIWVYFVIVAISASYRFILNRLQGEARFLSASDDAIPQPDYREQFLVKMLDKEYLVRVNEIEWVKSASNYVLLNCGNRHYPMRQTLKSLSEQLDPERFLRVHRTTIVNLDQVSSLQEKGDARVNLFSGESLPVSKTYLPELRAALAGNQNEQDRQTSS